METSTPVATAAQPDTISASHAAVAADDPGAYREARRAEKIGKPLDAVPVEAKKADAQPAVAGGEPEKPLSSKERHRLAENERIRAAVEEGVQKRLSDERTKWEQAHKPAATEPAPRAVSAAPAPAITEPPKTYEEAIQRPDVTKPLVSEDEFFKAFPDAPYSAYARYATRYDALNLSQLESRRTEQQAIQSAHKAQIDGFVKQLQDEVKADPEFTSKLSDRVKTQLKPFSALQRDASGRPTEQPGPINVIGEQVYASDKAPQMLRHFSEHPEDLDRLVAVPTHLASLPPALRTARHISWQIQEYGKLEASLSAPISAAANVTPTTPQIKLVSDAGPPARRLGAKPAEAGDPKTSAIRAGQNGVAAYRSLRRQEKAAAMLRR